jgi:hypothetical protein
MELRPSPPPGLGMIGKRAALRRLPIITHPCSISGHPRRPRLYRGGGELQMNTDSEG